MTERKEVDWDVLKNEYITDEKASFRSLGEKYQISASAIHRRAKEGDWAGKRKQFANDLEIKTLEKLKEERAQGEVKRLKALYDATDNLSRKISEAIEKVSPGNTLAIRQLCSSLRDIRIMEGLSPPESTVEDDGTLGVVVMPEVTANLVPPNEEEKEKEEVSG